MTFHYNPKSIILLLSSLSLISHSQAANWPSLFAPLFKDPATLQYLTRINQRTPSVPITLVVDLGGRYLWIDCDSDYKSSTFIHADCKNTTCRSFPVNPFTRTIVGSELALDAISLPATAGSPAFSRPDFLFSCAPASLTAGLAAGALGIAALGRTFIALPTQLALKFNFRHKRFAMCLPSIESATGALVFGPNAFQFLPNYKEASDLRTYTVLLINPFSTIEPFVKGEPSYEYFISVSAIKVGKTLLELNNTLLAIDMKTGYGGTKISTAVPYTTLETTIYKAFTEAFDSELTSATKAEAVAPFELCYEKSSFTSTKVGPDVPMVKLVLHTEDAVWKIFGANSMVEAKEGVLCLGFLDGGISPKTTIVIGGFQLENNLVEFDLDASKVGLSSSLLQKELTCSSFDFTLTA